MFGDVGTLEREREIQKVLFLRRQDYCAAVILGEITGKPNVIEGRDD